MAPRWGLLLSSLGLFLWAATAGANEDARLLGLLRDGGHVAVMRHALAPGTGDPANFRVDDCATQRNLSEVGRRQAEAIGARFRAAGIASARVFSSQWCRCLETARLLGLGPVTELPPLNSFFRDYQRRDEAVRGISAFLAGESFDRPMVLVTHQVNITALTGVYPTSGEIVLVRPRPDGSVETVGRIAPE